MRPLLAAGSNSVSVCLWRGKSWYNIREGREGVTIYIRGYLLKIGTLQMSSIYFSYVNSYAVMHAITDTKIITNVLTHWKRFKWFNDLEDIIQNFPLQMTSITVCTYFRTNIKQFSSKVLPTLISLRTVCGVDPDSRAWASAVGRLLLCCFCCTRTLHWLAALGAIQVVIQVQSSQVVVFGAEIQFFGAIIWTCPIYFASVTLANGDYPSLPAGQLYRQTNWTRTGPEDWKPSMPSAFFFAGSLRRRGRGTNLETGNFRLKHCWR